MPPKTLKSVLKVTCSDDDDDANANANVDVDVDVDVNDESNSEEHAAIIAEKGKGKAAMKVSAVILGEKCTYQYFRLLSKLTAVPILNCTQLRLQEMETIKLPPMRR
jgi:hypothetical protein